MAGFLLVSTACVGPQPPEVSGLPPTTVSGSTAATPRPSLAEDPTLAITGAHGDDPSDDVRASEGALVAFLTVHALGLERFPIRMGVSLWVLSNSIGLYPGAEYPGMGNFATAGHRVTPVAGRPRGPYYDLDRLHRGDRARLLMDGKVYVFALRRVFIVEPTRVSVLWPRRADLTMTACHPKGSLAERIVAFWDMLRTTVPER